MQKNRNYIRYALYDLDDNYIFEGTIKELSKYTGHGEDSLRSSISHIKHERDGRKAIRFNNNRYYIYKMED